MLQEYINNQMRLEQQIVDNNEELMYLLGKLPPEEKKVFAPIVQAMVEKTTSTIKRVNSEHYK